MVVIETHPSYYKPYKIRLVAQKEPFMDEILNNLPEVLTQFYIDKNQIIFSPTLLKNFINERYNLEFHIVEVNQLIIKELYHNRLIGLDTSSSTYKKIYILSPKIVKIANDRILLGLEERWKHPRLIC